MEVKTHNIKVWPQYFKDIIEGKKTFEYRLNDRDYKEGDVAILHEWNPETEKYTGESIAVDITYILTEGFGLPDRYCIMSIKIIS